jgi:hypothetical protein
MDLFTSQKHLPHLIRIFIMMVMSCTLKLSIYKYVKIRAYTNHNKYYYYGNHDLEGMGDGAFSFSIGKRGC